MITSAAQVFDVPQGRVAEMECTAHLYQAIDIVRIIYLMERSARGPERIESGLSIVSNVALLSTRSLASDLTDCSQTNQEELLGWINRYCDRNSSSSADNDLR